MRSSLYGRSYNKNNKSLFTVNFKRVGEDQGLAVSRDLLVSDLRGRPPAQESHHGSDRRRKEELHTDENTCATILALAQ